MMDIGIWNKVYIKPLSVNTAWMGRRFKSKKYKEYEQALLPLLPDLEPIEGWLKIHIVFGFSNHGASDWDNPIKPFQDILQQKYAWFNDNKVTEASVTKRQVKKGEEYIEFSIERHGKII